MEDIILVLETDSTFIPETWPGSVYIVTIILQVRRSAQAQAGGSRAVLIIIIIKLAVSNQSLSNPCINRRAFALCHLLHSLPSGNKKLKMMMS